MMGSKTFQPKGVYHLNLEERIPAEHLLRQVAAVVDFAFVRRLTEHLRTRQAKHSLRLRLKWAETPMAELKER